MNAVPSEAILPPAQCLDCGDTIHDGNTCIECWRDRRELAIARDKEWWS